MIDATTRKILAISARDRAMASALVCAFALVLFGVVWLGDPPMSQHEARLPQLAREMVLTGHWQWATSGGRPWTERPPLAQWMTAIMFLLTDTDNSQVVARVLPVVCGVVVCWMYAGIAFRLTMNVRLGVLAGIATATTYQVTTYAMMAEDEIFLAMVNALALRVFIEAWTKEKTTWFPAFFLLLGLGCWLRGLMVGMAQIGAGVGTFLVIQSVLKRGSIRDRAWAMFAPWGPAIWTGGLLASLVIGWSWWLYVGAKVPAFWDNFRYDIFSGWGREPWWYYIPTLGWVTQPWLIPAIVGILVAFRRGWWFILCIAIAPVVIMSIPERKNHHYLVPIVGAWSVLGAIGMSAIWTWHVNLDSPRKQVLWSYGIVGALIGMGVVFLGVREMPLVGLPVLIGVGTAIALYVLAIGDGVSLNRPVHATVAFAITMCVGVAFLQTCYASGSPRRMADRVFAQTVEQLVPPDATLLVVQKEALDFFMLQFWLRPDAKLLHNITWVKDESIRDPSVYVVTRAFDRGYLESVGDVQEITRATYSRRESNESWRWTLFRLTYRADVDRYLPMPVNALQGLRRPDPNDESPYLGDRPPPYDPPLLDGAARRQNDG